MHPWLQEKYVNLLSAQLKNFTKKDSNLWNFSCPLCGDSSKKKKLRGYIYSRKNDLKFFCHNCSVGMRFENLLKQLNPTLYFEFVREKLNDQRPVKVQEEEKKEPVFDLFKDLKTIADLDLFHPARKYVRDRLIPDEYLPRLFYAPKFKRFVNTVIPQKFELIHDEPRLIIPYLDRDGSITGFTGRSFDPDAEMRYIAITLDNSKRSVFNLDRVNQAKPHYVVEGPIDAMFLPNCLAAGGSALRIILNENSIAVFDNQPRNEQLCKLIFRCIDEGKKVVIWPAWLEGKDINDFIKSGITTEELVGIISQSSYSGLMALVKFNEWKKV